MAPHRNWVQAEDDVLVDILTELTLDGKWKIIEQKLIEKLPTCGLTTTNIDSRIKTLKKHAMDINEMVTVGSGFEFDYMNNKLVYEKSLFDDWTKSHTNAKGLYGKAFPHLDALVEIFAEDRANGKAAASLAEELEKIEKEDEQEKEEENQHNTEQENDQQQSNQSESNSGKGIRKRVRSSSFDVVSGESSRDLNGLSLMANSFSKFVTGTLDHFEAVRGSLTEEADVNKRLF
ncbi:hypothetical protein MKW92_026489 [Papaver armeniacum]|nr:hypothetical protein MKW92_026489 [Papaver armeniacum]